jgi:hypothetical protein
MTYDPLGRQTAFLRGTLSSSGNNGSSLDTVANAAINTAANSDETFSLDAVGNWSSSATGSGTDRHRHRPHACQYQPHQQQPFRADFAEDLWMIPYKRANLLILAMLVGGIMSAAVLLGVRELRSRLDGPPFQLRPGVPPIDDREESELQEFMFVDPAVRARTGDFIVETDSPFYVLHARLTIQKDDLNRLLDAGWSVTPDLTTTINDSEFVESQIGRDVGWDYTRFGSSDFHIVNRSVASQGGAQGLVRPIPSGYLLYLDRGAPASHVPQNVRDIMAAGACNTSYPSQLEIDYRCWKGPATTQPSANPR